MGNDTKIKLGQKNVFGKRVVFYKKKWFIITAIVVVLVVGVASALIIIYRRNSMLQTNNDETAQTEKTRAVEINQTVSDAQKLSNDGDSKAADAVYDKAIAKSSDDYQKSILALGKATIYFNNADYANALKYAQQAESYDKNSTVYGFIAQIYEKQGDKTSAIEYYNKAISVIDNNDPLSEQDVKDYKSSIKVLTN